MNERKDGEANVGAASDDAAATEPTGVAEAEAEAGTGSEDAVQAELARLQQETGNLRELYLRKLADFDNFRKRKDKEMVDFKRQANAEMVRDLLPVVDNLERALATGAGSAGAANPAGIRAGVELTLRQFKDILARYGVTEVDPVGQPFDPSRHEAVSRLHTTDAEPDAIVQVLQKGYVLGDRLLRAAMVVVAAPMKTPAAAPVPPEPEREP